MLNDLLVVTSYFVAQNHYHWTTQILPITKWFFFFKKNIFQSEKTTSPCNVLGRYQFQLQEILSRPEMESMKTHTSSLSEDTLGLETVANLKGGSKMVTQNVSTKPEK